MNHRFRFICMGTLLAGLLVVPAALKADTITGTTVIGSMTSLNPGLSVTTPFTSPAVIGPGVEFNGAITVPSFSLNFGVTADFTNSGLILSITSANSGSGVRTSSGAPFLALTFSDSAFVTPFTLTSITCATGTNACSTFPLLDNGLVSNTLVASTLTLDLKNLLAGQIYTFSDVAPVPEPTSLTLLGTGLLGVLGAVRKTSSCLRKAWGPSIRRAETANA